MITLLSKMATFPWLELPAEMRALIRQAADELTQEMLYETCREEQRCFWSDGRRRRFEEIFYLAASEGHLAICQLCADGQVG